MKLSRPVIYTVLFAVVIAVVVWATEPEQKARRGNVAAPKSTPKASVSLYTKEDLTAKFSSVNIPAKDAFRPLIARRRNADMFVSGNAGIPAGFADGERNWVYSGLATVDGSRLALLENTETGEGVFVRIGENWKRATVSSITDETLVMVGTDGAPQVIKMGEPERDIDPEVAPMAVQPPLQGQIGGQQTMPIGVAGVAGAQAGAPLVAAESRGVEGTLNGRIGRRVRGDQ